MRSGTSFFDLTIYRKTLQRFWPIWAANLVIWLIALPLNGLTRLPTDEYSGTQFVRFVSRTILDACGGGSVLTLGFAICIGLVTAMAVCSHLYNSRSANFMAALPIRREGQFISVYLAGLTMLVAPNVVIFLLMLLVELVGGTVVLAPLAFWLLYQSTLNFFFYSFAVCIGMFAGHIIALPVFYGVFNIIAGAVYLLRMWVMEAFYYGYASANDWSYTLMYWFMPAMALSDVRMRGIPIESAGNTILGLNPNSFGWYDEGPVPYYAGYRVDNEHVLLVYALVAAALTVGALLLYRKRRMESAGDVVAVKAMRPVFRYGVAICAGLSLGFVSTMIVGRGELSYMIWMLIWGVVGAFVAQMFLDKSFRVFKKWKGAVGTAVFFLLMFAVVGFDLTGYETRVPDPARVVSVRINGLVASDGDYRQSMDNVEVTNPEIIANVTGLHRAIVENRDDYDPDAYNDWVTLQYILSDGTVMARSYHSVSFTGEKLRYAQAIVNDREVVWDAYGLDVTENELYDLEALFVRTYDTQTGTYQEYEIEAAGRENVLEAMLADFAAGDIGVWELSEYGTETFRMRLSFEFVRWDPQSENYYHSGVSIGVTEGSHRTLAALRACEPAPEVADSVDRLAGIG